MRRVVVTGMGIVSSIGNNSQEVLASLREGKSGIVRADSYAELGFRSQVHGSLKIDLDAAVDRRARRFMGDGAAYACISMDQAIRDAGLEPSDVSNERTGLIVGSGGPSTKAIVAAADVTREPGKGPKKVGPFAVPKAMSSTCSANLSTWFKTLTSNSEDTPEAEFVPFEDRYVPAEKPELAARKFFEVLSKRRSVRSFSERPVSRETLEWIVRAAHSAPSGANKQPWRFVAVSNPALKREIRLAAEEEEREFYAERASERWLADLAPLGTDEDKAYLEIAPWLIVVFKLARTDEGEQVYYSEESVGIATGFLLAAAQHAGLATLTHTPSPMKFLGQVLGRPAHERAYMLIPIGYPTDDCRVPAHAIHRRPLGEVLVFDRDGRPGG